MRSKIISFTSVVQRMIRFIHTVSGDKVTVYSARAAFYVIISAVPFISLLFAAAGFFLPSIGEYFRDSDIHSAAESSALISFIAERLTSEIKKPPSVSLLSFSAVTTLWSASRGVSAIRGGLDIIYKADRRHSYLKHRIKSIVSTALFIVFICSAAAVAVFSELLCKIFGKEIFFFPKIPMLLFFSVSVIFFTYLYVSCAKRSNFVSRKILPHIPGAIFTSVGWIVFSYFYSLYITNVPSASYIYGSLSALCIGMLWTYFSVFILFLGAEINKALCKIRMTKS